MMSSKDNYNNASKLYYKLLDAAAKNKPPDLLMRQNWINMMISRVEAAKKLMESNDHDMHPKAKEALIKYEVIKVTSPNAVKEKKLFVKTSEGILCETIPLLNTYPVVLKAHIVTKHGEEAQMAEWLLQSKQSVAPICFAPLLDSCTVCKDRGNIPISDIPEPQVNSESSSQSSTKKDTNEIGYISMIDMAIAKTNDELLDTLLIYQDDRTEFILLRPVCSCDLINSISSELLQIFSDTNPPKYLVVPTSITGLIKQVLQRLIPIFEQDIGMETKDGVAPEIIIKINNALINYLNKTDDANWCVGCYIVQWELNNMPGNDGKSPFEKVFGQSADNSVVISSFNLLDSENFVTSGDSMQIDCDVQMECEMEADINDFILENDILELPSEFD